MLQRGHMWRVVGVAIWGRGSSWSGGEASRGLQDRSSFASTSPNPPESTSTTQPQPQPPTFPVWCLSSSQSVLITLVNSPLAWVPGFCISAQSLGMGTTRIQGPSRSRLSQPTRPQCDPQGYTRASLPCRRVASSPELHHETKMGRFTTFRKTKAMKTQVYNHVLHTLPQTRSWSRPVVSWSRPRNSPLWLTWI